MNERTLASACERLTRLLGVEAPDLSVGAERSLSDRVWVWGVLGGKEVGKSTLINALAGAISGEDIVEAGNDGGEGTRLATAFVHPEDADAVRARLRDVEVVPTSTTPRLALVDLPDFDSNFRDHAALVHAISPTLDGIIWVTTPKKIADVRAVEEIQRLLQSRTNFLYVVNKGDWLLERTGRVESLDRLRGQLEQQARASGESEPSDLAFIISARGTALDGDLKVGGDRLASDFARLRATLTSPPQDSESRKRANVSHANRILAARVLEHYGVDDARRRLSLAIDRIGDASARAMSQAFAGRLLRRLIDDRVASDEWTSDLFRHRVGSWSLVGAIAWPIASLGRLLSRLRSSPPDPFRVDAMDLGERIEQVRGSMDAPLAPVLERLDLEMPDGARLEQQFRADATEAALALRHQAFMRVRGRDPSAIGRVFRWVLPLVILLWFPLVQPLLATGLQLVNEPFSLSTLQRLVESLSPTAVLAGLTASGILLALLAGIIYAGAVRDASRAVAWLRDVGDAELLETLCASLSGRIQEPLREVLVSLDEVRASLSEHGGPSDG